MSQAPICEKRNRATGPTSRRGDTTEALTPTATTDRPSVDTTARSSWASRFLLPLFRGSSTLGVRLAIRPEQGTV